MKYFKVSVLCLALFSCAAPQMGPETPLALQLEGKSFNAQKKILSKACFKEAKWAPHPRRTNYNATYEDLCVQMKKAMRSAESLKEPDTANANVELRWSLALRCGDTIREYDDRQDDPSAKHSKTMNEICRRMTGFQ